MNHKVGIQPCRCPDGKTDAHVMDGAGWRGRELKLLRCWSVLSSNLSPPWCADLPKTGDAQLSRCLTGNRRPLSMKASKAKRLRYRTLKETAASFDQISNV